MLWLLLFLSLLLLLCLDYLMTALLGRTSRQKMRLHKLTNDDCVSRPCRTSSVSPSPPSLSGCLSTLRIRPASRTVCQIWPAGTGLSPPSHAFLPSLALCWPMARNCAKSIKLFANWWHNFAALRSTVHLTVCPSHCPPIWLSVSLSHCLPICLSVSLSHCTYIRLSLLPSLVGSLCNNSSAWLGL